MKYILIGFLAAACGGYDGNDMANPYGGIQGPAPSDALAMQNKLGNFVDMRNTDVLNAAGQGPEKTILDINLNDYALMKGRVLEPGSWVLTFRTEVLTPAVPPGVNPLVARVQYGSGGASTRVDVSISPGSAFQISADRVRASVVLEGLINGPDVTLPPTLQRVSAVLRRGEIESVPVRSFFINTIPAVPGAITGIIPPLAVDVFVHGNNVAANNVYNAGTLLTLTGGGVVLATYSGTDLRNSQLAGNPLPVPAGSTEWNVLTPLGLAITGPFSVEFGLDL